MGIEENNQNILLIIIFGVFNFIFEGNYLLDFSFDLKNKKLILNYFLKFKLDNSSFFLII